MAVVLELENGKYKVIDDPSRPSYQVLRYDQPWRDFTGDKFINGLIDTVKELRQQVISLGGTPNV